jgi:hypothetical protein
MSKNSIRVRHTTVGNLFRKDNLYDILNDLAEEDAGKGFSEVTKTGVFVTKIDVYTDVSKTILRTSTDINRIGVFTSNIAKKIYADDGVTLVATLNANINRDAGNNTVISIDTSVTRAI